MIKIGVPRGLLYYEYYPLWESFFKNLDLEVVLSPNTNKDILDSGIASCVDEACLPIKIFHGHVDYLKGKVDYLFIPRYISLHKREYNCPKHLGIVEMVLNSIDDLPSLISPNIKIKSINDFKKAAFEVGRMFSNNHRFINNAYKEAIQSQQNHLNWLSSEIIPKRIKTDKDKYKESIRLLVIGHSYNVYDHFINMGILNKLNDNNVELVFAEDIDEDNIRFYSNNLVKRVFWTHGRRIIGAAYSLIENKKIDGIIYLSAFGCGLDSVLMYLVEDKAIKSNIPVLIMTFDEQTGEAGFNTRLEAFLDMMEWRHKIEDNFSSSR